MAAVASDYLVLRVRVSDVIYRSIKLSSPKLSNIIAAGCILVYAAVILLGMDYSTLPANEIAFPIICTVSASIFAK